jgi:hypothetical protein
MSFRWSFSTDKLFRRCQRQFFFREIAAHHSEKEPWRREAFVLKQLKTLELWRGSVIHEGIQHYVLPALRTGDAVNWQFVTDQTISRAKRQLTFSEQKRYRAPGISKTKNEDFCALVAHENGTGVSSAEFATVCEEIRTAFHHLASMSDLWQPLLGRKDLQAEQKIWIPFDDVQIMVQIDLLFDRSLRYPTIIDWKSYELGGDTDARLQTVLYGWALWKSKRFAGLRSPGDIELLECQVQEGVLTKHECSFEVFEELEDYLYRSLHRIFSLCRSKKLGEARLQDFAFTDNSNNCEHCTFRQLCVEKASLWVPTNAVEVLPARREKKGKTLPTTPQPTLF